MRRRADPSPHASALRSLFVTFEEAQRAAMAAMTDADALAEQHDQALTDRQRAYVADLRERAGRAADALRY